MATTLTLKNIPDLVYQRLKASAEENRRSLNSEAIVCLEMALLPAKKIRGSSRAGPVRCGPAWLRRNSRRPTSRNSRGTAGRDRGGFERPGVPLPARRAHREFRRHCSNRSGNGPLGTLAERLSQHSRRLPAAQEPDFRAGRDREEAEKLLDGSEFESRFGERARAGERQRLLGLRLRVRVPGQKAGGAAGLPSAASYSRPFRNMPSPRTDSCTGPQPDPFPGSGSAFAEKFLLGLSDLASRCQKTGQRLETIPRRWVEVAMMWPRQLQQGSILHGQREHQPQVFPGAGRSIQESRRRSAASPADRRSQLHRGHPRRRRASWTGSTRRSSSRKAGTTPPRAER